MNKQTGLAQVYICHSLGFNGHLRPSYDSAPVAKGELTVSQLRTLNSRIAKYVRQCDERNKKLETRFS